MGILARFVSGSVWWRNKTMKPGFRGLDYSHPVAPLSRPGKSIVHVRPSSISAFTLVEIMIAIGILALIMTAIFSTWTAILRSTKVGLDTAAAVQRARI